MMQRLKCGWLNYYIPLEWTFTTRDANVINVISFFLIDALPSFYIVSLFNEVHMELLLHWFIAFFTMFCFYECGYIFNEVICVRFEDNPTLRIPEPFFSKILQHLENLITLRLVFGFLGSAYLLSIYPQNRHLYIGCILLLMIIYSIHNFYRGFINILTMPLEVLLKYLIPISIFVNEIYLIQSLIIVFLVIVLLRTIEYVSKKRYISCIRLAKNVDVFRVKYYVVINFIFFILIYNGILTKYSCGLPLFFLLYRIASNIAMKKMVFISNIINRGRQMHGTDK